MRDVRAWSLDLTCLDSPPLRSDPVDPVNSVRSATATNLSCTPFGGAHPRFGPTAGPESVVRSSWQGGHSVGGEERETEGPKSRALVDLGSSLRPSRDRVDVTGDSRDVTDDREEVTDDPEGPIPTGVPPLTGVHCTRALGAGRSSMPDLSDRMRKRMQRIALFWASPVRCPPVAR